MEWWVYGLIGTILGSFSMLSRKKILFREHALEFSGFRSIMNLMLLAGLSFFITLEIDRKNFILLFITGIIASVGLIYRNKAVRHDDISEITPLGSLSGVLVLILGILFLDETLTKVQFAGLMIVVIGVYILKLDTKSFLKPFKYLFTTKAILHYFVALIIFSFCTILLRTVLQEINPYTTMFYTWLFISIPIILTELGRYGIRDLNHFKRDFKQVFFISAMLFISNIFFYISMSMPGGKASLAHTLRLSEGILITAIGGIMFHEDHIIKRTISSLIIIAGVLMMIL